jgi:hypothetical protein
MDCSICFETKVCLVQTACCAPFTPKGHAAICCLLCLSKHAKQSNVCPYCRAPLFEESDLVRYTHKLGVVQDNYLRAVQESRDKMQNDAKHATFMESAMKEFVSWVVWVSSQDALPREG